MSHSVLDSEDLGTLSYISTHVFCPLQLPDGDDHSATNDHSLAGAVTSAARLYCNHIDPTNRLEWNRILRMLGNLEAIVQFEVLDRSQATYQLNSMHVGDVLAFLIRAQNAAVVFRKQKDVTVFESFEVSPRAQDVMTTQGKLICSYPGPAIEVPNTVFGDENFLHELINFLVHMNNDVLDAVATTRKAQSTIHETRDTTHPRYITELFTGILRSVGRPADIVRISKRVGDDVVWNKSNLPWRRSPLWLLIRVVLQTSLVGSTFAKDSYKEFMLFFMCCLAKEDIAAGLPNALLQIMLSKISQRLRKLGSSSPDWLSRIVLQTCISLRSTLEKRWRQVQAAERVLPVWAPSQLDLTRDVQLSLLSSRDHIGDSLANQSVNPVDSTFSLHNHPRGALDDFLSSDGSFFKEAYQTDPYVTLYDVERAVEEGIDNWVDRVTDNNEACVKLELLGNKYSAGALKRYKDNPELLSVMVLTTVELWIALDKVAVNEVPMLAEYSPEIPINLLENLLLRRAHNLCRLRHAYQYLTHRHSQSHSGWSVFSPSVTQDSFAIRYFEESSDLQALKDLIEGNAQREVDKKVVQLEKANTRYVDQKKKCLNTEHASAVTQDGREFHPKKCSRCRLEQKLGRMEIAVHEWPLPDRDLQAQVVVFELDCPVSFNMWRTATLHLLLDLCSPTPEPENPYIKLDRYEALRPYLKKHPRSRVALASDAKPFVVTHYGRTSIPSTEKRVCVKNGLKVYLFDSHARVPLSGSLFRIDARQYYTYELQNGPYGNLQKYVDATSHTSNEILANQVDCHEDLSIHEFIAFGHLRCGGLLQWLNILRALRDRSLSFRRGEVHSLIAQAVSQVGPLVGLRWIWHEEIQQPSFCYALIEELESLLGDVKANWLEGVTMNTISFMLSRLLTSSPDQATSYKALGLLRAVREKVFSWVMDLSKKLAESHGDEELRALLRDTAAICRSTFDIDPSVVQNILCSAEDVEILLSCAMIIHDNTPANISSLPPHSKLLLDRDRRLSLALESALSEMIQTPPGYRGLDRAILRVWPFYRPGSRWCPLQHSDLRWFSCTTASTASQCSQVLYLDLLDGSLLVNGKPLGKLPSAIMQRPLYNLLFGKVLDVMPADLRGMDYSTRDVICGHQVYFCLTDDHLVIRAKRVDSPNSAIVELISPERFVGDLPAVLIEEHVHWLDLSKSILEIRPLDMLWESSAKNWKIDCRPGKCHAYQGAQFLVDIRSPTWTMVSNLLKPLDSPQNLIITVSPVILDHSQSCLQLSVELPRYGLSFYVDEDGDLQSLNIRQMVYDEDQSIGTMFGLVNKLVLRPKAVYIDAEDLVPRCVLIPEGRVSFCLDSHHVCVEIDTQGPALQRITYQTYKVDTDLGCLTGNVSLTNKLYCAYLHALTSGCDTDPLTGRSGTEEALSLLRSGNCWSIMKISARDEELLGLIASICPSRTWYPENRRSMQKVEWLELPVSSQHPELHIVAKAIKEHCEKVSLFHGSRSSPLFQTFPICDDILLNRSALRAKCLLSFEFSSQSSGANFDVHHLGRDRVGSGEHRAYTAATVVYRRTSNATAVNGIKTMLESSSWKDRTVSRKAPLSFQYDRSWVDPNFSSIWLEAYNQLRHHCDETTWSQMLFSLPTMAYASSKFSDLVPAFVAFAIVPSFLSPLADPPTYDSYNISDGCSLSQDTLHKYASDCALTFEESPESTEPARPGESSKKLRNRQLKMFSQRRDSDINTVILQLLSAWPCEIPPPCSLDPDLYDVDDFTSNVRQHFFSCYRNLKLNEHLARVQNVLNSVNFEPLSTPAQYSFQPAPNVTPSVPLLLTMDQLLLSRPAPPLREPETLLRQAADRGNASRTGYATLQKLIITAEEKVSNPFMHQYILALRTSAEYLRNEATVAHDVTKVPAHEALTAHYARCRNAYTVALHTLRKYLSPWSKVEKALAQSGLWPRNTAHSLFRCLASNSPIVLSGNWRTCLTRLALLGLELQRARRLLCLCNDELYEELRRELENEGCDGWNAEAYPDWLLIQLQGNFLIRRVQVDVATQMISPVSGTNTAMQLNMGEGKSSVIIPISVSVLANSDQLVRVIVPKALTTQMFQLLVDRLGGLTNRRIYYIPFARSLEVSLQQVVALHELVAECMKESGILVIQPEHILSLKLVSVENQLSLSGNKQVSSLLLGLQKWLHCHSRDILDESDEILHVRYQLVYTIGLQRHVEASPERWTVTQQILSLVKKHAASLRTESLLSAGVEYERGPCGSFPHFRILEAASGEELISRIVQDIMDGHLSHLNFQAEHKQSFRDAIQTFISSEDIIDGKVQWIKAYARHGPIWGVLLLLRGLLTSGILLFAFSERRWRVDYGLAPARTMLAVPYRAKDVPAQRAEFGHPDVAIILTCLSYYYGGLNEEQLKTSFEILLEQDDPSSDYDLWVRECPDVPESLQSFTAINVKSSEQWRKSLIPLFSRNKATVDFYLSKIVFPREAKEFPSKLSCSGWDLAEKKDRLLTGFSGTNDGQYLLPLHITQRDPNHQRGTNAKVLSYLLQPENNHYICTTHDSGERRNTHQFLEILVAQKPAIRVLLDVGAQMLDLQNFELARAWLAIYPAQAASAAIYFNEDDELTVLTRDGSTQLLLSSPFAQQLDRCIVYLDDAHTRGTDMNFPSGFRAAVTLGPKVTKDRLVQGCMRMRKLGHGHSVMFFGPNEVDRRIRSVVAKGPSTAISTMEILQWAIHETCDDIQQRAPHWAQQGMDHASRYDVWAKFSKGGLTPGQLSAKWLQPEAKKLEDLYAPRSDSKSAEFRVSADIRRHCGLLGVSSLEAIILDEEQEREVVHEAERERQVERPQRVPPAVHSINPNVVAFIMTGTIPPHATAFRPAFEILNATSAAPNEVHVWNPNVLATTDFVTTVVPSGKLDGYLRPVQWIASGKRCGSEVLVILSPFEVNHLLPHIRSWNKVHLHLYTPRTTKSMEPCDDLALYNIPAVPPGWMPPSNLMDELNVFAGQLYLKDYKTYARLEAEGRIQMWGNGFKPATKNRPKRLQSKPKFQGTQVGFVKALMSLRRKGLDFSQTHMGRLLDGQVLLKRDFDEEDHNAQG